MEEKGVGVRELSRRTGLSLGCVRKLRRGGMNGNLYSWQAIAKALETTIDELVRE